MPVQSHIHLSDTLGGAPENAPDLKWTVSNRSQVPRLIGAVNYTLTGHFRHYEVLDDLGDPLRLVDYSYMLVIKEQYGYDIDTRVQQLISMLGKIVYLVDNIHPDDAADHTASVKTMYLNEIGEFTPINVGLIRYEVEITLLDANRA